jgi:hypothetical protein
LFELDPASAAALEEFCATLSQKQATYLKVVVQRVCEDPSGKRQPTHNFTRQFKNPSKYAAVPDGTKVWELKTNHYRGLFITAEVEKAGLTHRRLIFLPVNGERFMLAGDAPWPH